MFRVFLIGVIIFITGATAFDKRSISVTININSEEVTVSLVETAFPASDREIDAKKRVNMNIVYLLWSPIEIFYQQAAPMSIFVHTINSP